MNFWATVLTALTAVAASTHLVLLVDLRQAALTGHVATATDEKQQLRRVPHQKTKTAPAQAHAASSS